MVETFWCGDVLPFQELETHTGWTTHWPKWSTTLFFRGMLYLLAFLCVENDLFSSRTMVLNMQWRCARTVWSWGKSKECWHACLSLYSHQTSALTEHHWEYLKRQKVKATVTSQDCHWDVPRKTTWIMWIVIYKLVESTPVRVQAVVKADSGLRIFTFIITTKRYTITKTLC